jgi:hypothetical protein
MFRSATPELINRPRLSIWTLATIPTGRQPAPNAKIERVLCQTPGTVTRNDRRQGWYPGELDIIIDMPVICSAAGRQGCRDATGSSVRLIASRQNLSSISLLGSLGLSATSWPGRQS